MSDPTEGPGAGNCHRIGFLPGGKRRESTIASSGTTDCRYPVVKEATGRADNTVEELLRHVWSHGFSRMCTGPWGVALRMCSTVRSHYSSSQSDPQRRRMDSIAGCVPRVASRPTADRLETVLSLASESGLL